MSVIELLTMRILPHLSLLNIGFPFHRDDEIDWKVENSAHTQKMPCHAKEFCTSCAVFTFSLTPHG